jgi:diaminopimelate epimerase
MALKFTKMHGAGNDYVLVDGRSRDLDWAGWAKRLTDRHFGVGADGLLVVAPSSRGDTRMRMFNPDGSEAEMCGNGIRCFAKYVLEQGIVPNREGGLQVETSAGVLTVEPRWENSRVTSAKVGMGEPELRWKAVPVNTYEASIRDERLLDHDLLGRLGLRFDYIFFEGRLLMTEGHRVDVTAVSLGNPHAVQFLQKPIAEFPLRDVGPLVEWNPAFPNKVNYHVVNVLGRDRLAMRSWERGAGETLACGTGACAVVVAARLHKYVDDTVTVQVPGGELTVTWPGHGQVFLEGPAAEVFSSEWSD